MPLVTIPSNLSLRKQLSLIKALITHNAVTSACKKEGGEWRLHYQKRAVNSSQWVNESVDRSPEVSTLFSESVETLLWILQAGAIPIFVVAFAFWWSREEKPFDLDDEAPLEAELVE